MTKLNRCGYCEKYSLPMKVIDRPKSYVKSFSKYIYVCSACSEIHQLEHYPEYKPTALESFIDAYKLTSVYPTLLEYTDGEKYLTLSTDRGHLFNSEQLKLLANELLKTSELNELDQFTKSENIKTYFYLNFSEDPDNTNKFLIPLNKLNIDRKQFNSTKRWGCTCGNCSVKMSSKKDKEYFTICPDQEFNVPLERACSESCMKVIAKEIVTDWINKNKYQDFFDLDKLDSGLVELIKNT